VVSPITAPNTGDAGLAASENATGLYLLIGGLIAAAGLAGGLAIARRRA
jgi:hypothetical protein